MMTPITGTEPAGQPTRRKRGRPVLAGLLILTFLGVLVLLAVLFQPLADAAGGCGGG